MCRTGSEVLRKRPACSVAVASQLYTAIESFVADMPKRKAQLSTKFKCICVTIYAEIYAVQFSRMIDNLLHENS